MRFRTVRPTIVLAVVIGCGGETPTETEQPRGAIRVRTTTTGMDIDPDGYTATIQSIILQVGATDSTFFGNLLSGNYNVELGGLEANCTPDRTSAAATVAAPDTATVEFAVACMQLTPGEGNPGR